MIPEPLAPGYLQVIKYDPSSPSTVILNLASWTEVNSGQLLTPCPILTLSVQYRPSQDPKTGREDDNVPWNLLVNATFPKGLARICDVQKGVWYVIRMTAVNEAGTTVANYEFFADENFTGGFSCRLTYFSPRISYPRVVEQSKRFHSSALELSIQVQKLCQSIYISVFHYSQYLIS